MPVSGHVLNQVLLRQHVLAGSMMFSRQLFDKVDGFDENLKEEDWGLVIRCATKTSFSAVSDAFLLSFACYEFNENHGKASDISSIGNDFVEKLYASNALHLI